MATFKVGQRVRIVRADRLPYLVGSEATIERIEMTRRGLGYLIALTCPIRRDACVAHALSSELEPLQPERNRVVAWEDCPFDPRKIAEIA